MKEGFRTAVLAALANFLMAVAFGAASPTRSFASAIGVYTYHYNNLRTGANRNETVLTPAKVNVNQFGKLFSVPVDSGIYTQPLYVPGLAIPGKGTHNAV